MASHGIPRTSAAPQKSEEARRKELEEIKRYQNLVEEVNREVSARNYTPTLLRQTAELLKQNPEYYTIWNHRRRIYAHEFATLNAALKDDSLTQPDRDSQILDIIKLDLQFLFPLLLKFPKCYWIWNHRLWLLNSSTDLLPPEVARRLWEEDFVLVGKMLDRDSRNFHGWGYRRTIVAALEGTKLAPKTKSSEKDEEKSRKKGTSMAQSELDYTTKMIKSNLSNFSAWHNRTLLIIRTLNEQNATDLERKHMFEEELKLIHSALFDPYDASLWSYHMTLLCTLDPLTSSTTMAPNLSPAERMQYLESEKSFILEMLDEDYPSTSEDEGPNPKDSNKEEEEEAGEGADDCKWVYQRLIDIVMIIARVRSTTTSSPGETCSTDLTVQERKELKRWLKKLHDLDPLRKGRWRDFQIKLGSD